MSVKLPSRLGSYFENCATFREIGLKKQMVLHEFYPYLVTCNALELSLKIEKREAINYAKEFSY